MSQDISSTQKPADETFELNSIGVIASDFKEKFGTPRQPGICPSVESSVVLQNTAFNKEAILGLEHCSHLWILAWFHKNKDHKPRSLVRPPRLGGNTRTGVFSTRSPYRPNPVSISVCELKGITHKNNKIFIHLSGCDLIEGTPILDIKPYVPYADCIKDASAGWADEDWPILEVAFSTQANKYLAKGNLEDALTEILCQDPRPAYQKKSFNKSYTFKFRDYDVSFYAVNETKILVESITPLKDTQKNKPRKSNLNSR